MHSWRLGAGAVDAQGYAVFGTPGPSTYETVSQFEHGGKRVFRNPGGPFSIQGRWKAEKIAFTSPGPQAHNPKAEAVTANPCKAVFGHATRETEARRFTAACLVSAPHEPRVGPGAYRNKCGKGHAKTFGDGPSTAIGDSPRLPEQKTTALQSPGAKYDLPSSLRSCPAVLGPRENAFGRPRDRQMEGVQARKQYHGPGVPTSATETPAPGHYRAEDGARAALRQAPKATFGGAPVSNVEKLATGGHSFEEGMKGTQSAAKFYDPVSTLDQRGAAAAHAKRFPDASKGLSGAGPFVSKQHTAHVLGVESPSAQYKVEPGYNATMHVAPAYTMASSRPQPPDVSATPGAAAYLLKKDSAAYKHPASAAFSMACGRAFQPPVSLPTGPGPGAHACERGIAHPDIRDQNAPTASIPRATDKHGRLTAMMSRDSVPGPGTYIGVETKPSGPYYSIRAKERAAQDNNKGSKLQRSRSEGAAPSGQRNIRRFYSRMQAEPGHETARAALANLQGQSTTGKEIAVVKKYVGKMSRASRADESKLLVSRLHSKACVGSHSPGPAEYSPQRALAAEIQSSHKHQGGFSFGKAERPIAKQGLAKISF